jgi:6-phosphogluconate dehydrogenase
MIGLGHQAASMVQRLMGAGHACVVFDQNPAAVQDLAGKGAKGYIGLDEFTAAPDQPRVLDLAAEAGSSDSWPGYRRHHPGTPAGYMFPLPARPVS